MRATEVTVGDHNAGDSKGQHVLHPGPDRRQEAESDR